MANPHASKKIITSIDVLASNLEGSAYAQRLINKGKKSTGGKKKGKAKKKLKMPPTSGWRGGNPDNNGIKASETYGSEKPMRFSATSNRHKVGGC